MTKYVNIICMQAVDTVPVFFVIIKYKHIYARDSSEDRIQTSPEVCDHLGRIIIQDCLAINIDRKNKGSYI